MARCEVCGNADDKMFHVRLHGHNHVFDCFECAIHALAPTCSHCGCKIIGHGVWMDDELCCCDYCARREERMRELSAV